MLFDFLSFNRFDSKGTTIKFGKLISEFISFDLSILSLFLLYLTSKIGLIFCFSEIEINIFFSESILYDCSSGADLI